MPVHHRLPLLATLALPLLTLIALFIVPIGVTAVYSLWSVNNDYELVMTPSLDQYRKVFSEPIYLATLLESVWLALLTTVLCVLLALPLAWFIARLVPHRWRVLLIVGLILPGWVSVLIRTYSMNLVLGEVGLLNWLLLAAGVIDAPLQILFTPTAVVIGLVYIYLPYTLVPIYAAVERLDPVVAGSGGKSRRRARSAAFRRVVLPLIMPGIVAGCIITFIPALGEYLVPNLLGGLSGHHVRQSDRNRVPELRLAARRSALSVVLLLAILGSLCWPVRGSPICQPRAWSANDGNAADAAASLSAFVVVDLSRSSICRSRFVVLTSFNEATITTLPIRALQPQMVRGALRQHRARSIGPVDQPQARRSAPRSRPRCSACSRRSRSCGTSFPGRRAFLALMTLPMIAPGIVLGVSLLLFARYVGFKTGFAALLLGHTLLALPYCTFIIIASLARFDRTLEDAARGLGASEFTRAGARRRCPNIAPGLLGALLFGFTISIGEFVVSFFLTSAGIDDPADPHLLDRQGRHHARDQRRFDA